MKRWLLLGVCGLLAMRPGQRLLMTPPNARLPAPVAADSTPAQRNNAAVALARKGNYPMARYWLNPIRNHPNDTIRYNAAIVDMFMGQTEYSRRLPATNIGASQLARAIFRCQTGDWAGGLADLQKTPLTPALADERAFNIAVAYWQTGWLGEATRALNESGPAISQPARHRLLQTDLLLLQGDETAAIAGYNALSQQRDLNLTATVTLRLANVRLRQRLFDEAIELFMSVLTAGNKAEQFSGRLGLANAFMGRAEFGKAISEYRTATRLDPASARAQVGLGNALCSNRAYKDALTAYRKALELAPTDRFAQLGLGVVLTRLNQPAEALAAFGRAEPIMNAADSAFADAFVLRGTAQLAQKQTDAARRSFQTVIDLRPNHPDGYAGLSEVHRQQRQYIPAIQSLTQAIDRRPDDVTMRTNRGSLLLKIDRPDYAYADFFGVVQQSTKHPNALNGLGICLLDQDRLEEALYTFEGLIGGGTTRADWLNNRAIALAYTGLSTEKKDPKLARQFFERSLRDLQQAQTLDSTGRFYQNNLGNAYRNADKPAEAARAYRTFSGPSGLNNLAILLAAGGQRAEARHTIDQAARIDSANAVIAYNRGRIYRAFYPDSLAQHLDIQRAELRQPAGGIVAKYSRDGYLPVYLYDYRFDAYDYAPNLRLPIRPEPPQPPDLLPPPVFLTIADQPEPPPPPPTVTAVVASTVVAAPAVALVLVAMADSTRPTAVAALGAASAGLPPLASLPKPVAIAPARPTPNDTPPPVAKSTPSLTTHRRQRMPRMPLDRRNWGSTACPKF